MRVMPRRNEAGSVVSAVMRPPVLLVAALLVAGCGSTGQPGGQTLPTATSASLGATATATIEPAHGQLSAADAILAEATSYPDDYCGRYQNSGFRPDLPGGAFVSRWRANLGTHEAHVRAMADGIQTLVFVGCTFAKSELEHLQDRLSSDEARTWLATIPAAPIAGAVDEINNRVELDISSAVGDAADRATAHFTALYGLPPGILTVWSDGNGAGLRPWGTIRITALGPDKRPAHVPNDLYLEWAGDLPNLRCGVGDVGYGINQDGRPMELPCQAGQWRISIDTGPNTAILGSGTVTVTGGKTVDLTINLSAVPTPHP